MLDKINSVIIQPLVDSIITSEAAMLLLIVGIAFDIAYMLALTAAESMGKIDQFREGWKTIKFIPIAGIFSIAVVCAITDPVAILGLLIAVTVIFTLGYALLICFVSSIIGIGKAFSK